MRAIIAAVLVAGLLVCGGCDSGGDGDDSGDTTALTADSEGTLSPAGGMWTDPDTSLTWERGVSNSLGVKPSMSAAYCDALVGGWRVPTISELRTLIRGCPATETGGPCQLDEGCSGTLCEDKLCYEGCAYFEGPGQGGEYWPAELQPECDIQGDCQFWSSSTNDEGSYGWFVNFGSAGMSAQNIALAEDMFLSGYNVRCVRK